MARITASNLEEDVVRALKRRAEESGRSVSEEIRAALCRDIGPDREQALERLARKRKQLASGLCPDLRRS